MKNKVKNVVIIILSLIVFFTIILPWVSGNQPSQNLNNITATTSPVSLSNYLSKPFNEYTAQPTWYTSQPINVNLPTYTASPTSPPISFDFGNSYDDTQTITVYITKTGKKYHNAGCQYLSKSCIPIDLNDAKAEGYTPCSKCHPPQ